jgi:hypothetical protein
MDTVQRRIGTGYQFRFLFAFVVKSAKGAISNRKALMYIFKIGDEVQRKGDHLKAYHPDEKTLVVIEVTASHILCLLEDGTSYPFPHNALELVISKTGKEVLRFLESNNGWITDNNDHQPKTAMLHDGTVGGGIMAEGPIDYEVFLSLKEKRFIAFNGTQAQPGRQYKITDAGRDRLKKSA